MGKLKRMGDVKASKFNVLFKEDNGTQVLVNLLSKAIAEVDKENETVVRKLLANPNDPELTQKHHDTLENLKYGGYIVDAEFDEVNHLKLINFMERFDRSAISVTVMPTMQCNFDCVYCYEDKTGPIMSPTTADTVANFLENMTAQKRTVSLGWFGGEPLIAFDLIEYINSRVIEAAERNKTEFNSFITTNGYLLDAEKSRKLEKLNVRSLQITLDGPPEYHDKYRILKGGGPTFDRIYSNIKTLFKETQTVTVKLRVNVGPDNYSSVGRLLDMLEEFPKDRFLVYFRWIFQGSEKNPLFHRKVREFEGTPKEKFQKLAKLYYMALERGFDVMLPITNSNVYCEYDRVSSVLIGPKGGLYLCTVRVGDKYRAGRITPDGPVYDSVLYETWHGFSAFEDSKCLNCPLLPLCLGGCRNARMNGMGRGCPEELGYIEEFAKLWYRVQKFKKESAIK